MMRAMTLRAVGAPLNLEQRLKSKPRRVEVLSWVEACGVRRTDLHVVDGAPISLLEPF
jgi:propanol-preferring alcohol dehydrogenase